MVVDVILGGVSHRTGEANACYNRKRVAHNFHDQMLPSGANAYVPEHNGGLS